jgi:hypothetical protein
MATSADLVQKAIYRLLSEDEILRQLVTGVFDDVPDEQPFPYVQIGEDEENNKPSTMLTVGRENVATIHIWSRALGYSEAERIAARVIDVLDGAVLDLPGWKWEGTIYEFAQYKRDNTRRHVALKFRVRSRRES